MHLTVTFVESDVVLAVQVSSDMTVADLRVYALTEAGFNSEVTASLYHNNKPLDDRSSLAGAGLQEDDMVLLSATSGNNNLSSAAGSTRREVPNSNSAGSESFRNNNSNAGSSVNGPANDYENTLSMQIEAARKQILYDPQLFDQLSKQSPELAEALHDPDNFQKAYRKLQQQQLKVKAENEEIDRNFQLAMEEMPEAFATVTMLFANIEVNGVPVKAFIDSGAQTTIMSPECAEKCHLSHLIDKRHRGMAYGVGQATILGRIHMAPIKIGSSYFACSMTVIEGTNMEFLLGLDMLKHHQTIIDLKHNKLIMGEEELPFLTENEIPKNLVGPPATGPAMMSQSNKGASRGATNNSSSSADPRTNQSNNGGSSAHEPSVGSGSSASTKSETQYDQTIVSNLMSLGFTKPQVLRALTKSGGNADAAASLLFGG